MADIKNLVGFQNVKSLGVVMNTPGAAAANRALLQAWADAIGSTSDRGLFFPAGDVYITGDPWTFSGNFPPIIWGNHNISGIYGTLDALRATSGVSRLIGMNMDPAVIVFEEQSIGANISGIQINGYAATSEALMLAGSASWSTAGILLKEGSGQISGQMLQFCCLGNGIVCGVNDDDEQTDVLVYDQIAGTHCSSSIIRTVSNQSVIHKIGFLRQFGCPVGIYSEQSTDFQIDQWYVGSGDGGTTNNDTLLKVDYSNINSSGCVVDKVLIDGTENKARLINMTGHSFASMQIGFLRLPNNFSTADGPTATLRGAGSLDINGGMNFVEGMFRGFQALAADEGQDFFPTFTVEKARMATGKSAAAFGRADVGGGGANQTHTCLITTDKVRAYGGSIGARVDQTWIDGVLQ